MFTVTDLSFALKGRGITASPATITRLLRVGIIPATAIVGGRHVWDLDGLDDTERRIRAYRASLNRRVAA